MKEREKRAEELHIKGYNCAQTVVCLFPEVFPDIRQAFKMSEPFGFGMGQESICGAVTGMAMIIGAVKSDGDMESPKTEEDTFAITRQAIKDFESRYHSLKCSDIRDSNEKCGLTCGDCINDAIDIVEKLLKIK